MANVFELRREILTDNSTKSLLFEPDGSIVCDCLEDTDRDLNMNGLLEEGKVYGETAIPYGFYEIVMKHSPHFNRKMPYIVNVPTHTDTMFHWGNRPENTKGCVLVGERGGEDFIANSRKTFEEKLMPTIAKYFSVEDKLYVQVTKSQQATDRRARKELQVQA